MQHAMRCYRDIVAMRLMSVHARWCYRRFAAVLTSAPSEATVAWLQPRPLLCICVSGRGDGSDFGELKWQDHSLCGGSKLPKNVYLAAQTTDKDVRFTLR